MTRTTSSARHASLRSVPPDALRPHVLSEKARRRAEKARSSLRDFVELAWPIIEPGNDFIPNWHIDAICAHLEAVSRGEITRLLINLPPRMLKSRLVSVMWPAWVWVSRPGWSSIFASYAGELAKQDSISCRQVIDSSWYREHFSGPAGWELTDDQNTKTLYRNTAGGQRQATSVGGGATGFGGDAIVADDPLNAEESVSKADRDRVNRWWDKTMPSRLNDQRTGARVVIQQRFHEDDLSGHILARGGYEYLCLPAEYDRRRRSITYHRPPPREAAPKRENKLFWSDPRTEDGELLFPERFPRYVMARLRADLLEEGYAAQYQQLPSPAGGGMFRIADWRFWKPDGVATVGNSPRPSGCYEGEARALRIASLDRQIISVDATFKETTDGSFVAIHVWGRLGADRYLLARHHERMDFDATVSQLLRMMRSWPEARDRVIEAKAAGDPIMSHLTNKYGVSGLIAENPGHENKEVRARAMLTYHRGGNIYLPDGAPWLDEYIAEHAIFPRGKHDDDVDAQSQALKHLEDEPSTAENYLRTSW